MKKYGGQWNESLEGVVLRVQFLVHVIFDSLFCIKIRLEKTRTWKICGNRSSIRKIMSKNLSILPRWLLMNSNEKRWFIGETFSFLGFENYENNFS